MSVGTRHMMRYTNALEEGIEFFIFPSPITLNRENFSTEFSFYKTLEIMKNLKDLGLMFEQIYPGVLAIIIYEANIISMSPY